jgi:hypothetical protein
MLPAAKGALALRGALPRPPRLKVHDVGDFEASFVPTPADFARLDPRFRLPERVLTDLTSYGDWGFAVVQLRRSMTGLWGWLRRTRNTMQPLALEFPTRDPDRLFFPTLHVHDGQVHGEARFDHTLYWQHPRGVTVPPARGPLALGATMDVSGPAAGFVKVDRAHDLVDGEAPCHRRVLVGTLPNHDTWIDVVPRAPLAAAA